MLQWQWSNEGRQEVEVWQDNRELKAIITKNHIYDCTTDMIYTVGGSLVKQLSEWSHVYASGQLITRNPNCTY